MLRLCSLLSLMICCSALVAATQVPLVKNGNIRYGPSLKAGVIVTLSVGDTVEILSPVEGKAGWYRIRFPRKGHAWIHEKVVAPTEREGVLKVIVDGARVRSDATIGGEVVTDLAIGEEVETKGRKVGAWYKVYVPSATAYVFHSVLDMHAVQQASSQIAAANHEAGLNAQSSDIDRLWSQLQEIYREYHAVYVRNRAEAATLDWQGMVAPLKRVVDEHPDLRTRLVAERMRSVILRMQQVGVEPLAPEKMGIAAPAPAQPAAQQPVTKPPAAQEPMVKQPGEQAPVAQQPSQPEQPVTPTPEPAAPAVTPAPTPATPAPNPAVAAMPEGTVVEGWIEPREVSGLGMRYVVLGDRGVAAFITLAADSGVDLRQLFWRRVRVIGESVASEPGLPPEYANVPTVAVRDIRVIQ